MQSNLEKEVENEKNIIDIPESFVNNETRNSFENLENLWNMENNYIEKEINLFSVDKEKQRIIEEREFHRQILICFSGNFLFAILGLFYFIYKYQKIKKKLEVAIAMIIPYVVWLVLILLFLFWKKRRF